MRHFVLLKLNGNKTMEAMFQEKEGRGRKAIYALNYEFNRISFNTKKDTRQERLVEGNSFKCNIKIHSVQNK